MSSTYNLEPPPTAKVIVNTTAGDIELEIFAKQTPIASRNFLQLCLDGYYINTVFHRLVPGFILQGGDPTGTGSGGESSLENGQPFQDEFHTRLRFNRRGLLGMANQGKDSNASQFFMTLGDTPELQDKNTMFGRVVGDTLYNLMKMGEGELAGADSDRPLYPYKITGSEILVNPFEDMVKRDLKKRAVAAPADKDRKKPKRKAGKAILSFGGDEEGDEDVAPVIKKPKFNPKLVSSGHEALPKPVAAPTSKSATETKKEKPAPKPRKSRSPTPPKREQILSGLTRAPASKRAPPPSDSDAASGSSDGESDQVRKVSELVSRTNAQIEELKASMRRAGPTSAAPAKKKSVLEAMIPETSTRGRKRGAAKEDTDALRMFNAFKNKLDAVPAVEAHHGDTLEMEATAVLTGEADDDEDEAALCDLHFIANCQSCSRWDETAAKEDDDDLEGSGWMSHKLTFAKDRLGKSLEWKRKNEEELVVIDPREREKDLGVGMKKGRKGNEEQRKQRHIDRPGDREKKW